MDPYIVMHPTTMQLMIQNHKCYLDMSRYVNFESVYNIAVNVHKVHTLRCVYIVLKMHISCYFICCAACSLQNACATIKIFSSVCNAYMHA